MTEPTLEQVAADLLKFTSPDRGYTTDTRNSISLDFLDKYVWPKMGEPMTGFAQLENGNWQCLLSWAEYDYGHGVEGYGVTRVEAAARATWKVIQKVKHD